VEVEDTQYFLVKLLDSREGWHFGQGFVLAVYQRGQTAKKAGNQRETALKKLCIIRESKRGASKRICGPQVCMSIGVMSLSEGAL